LPTTFGRRHHRAQRSAFGRRGGAGLEQLLATFADELLALFDRRFQFVRSRLGFLIATISVPLDHG